MFTRSELSIHKLSQLALKACVETASVVDYVCLYTQSIKLGSL